MKIAIHNRRNSFSDRWISYCEKKQIEWKPVDCYRYDIIYQLEDCDALMWHFSYNKLEDFIFAKQLLYSVEAAGKRVFPNFHTSWHFDDKLGQKYLLEALEAPLVPTWVFYDKREALNWIKVTDFPKVFKLRCGAGAQNVLLVPGLKVANRLINKAFGRGFLSYDAMGNLKERWRKYRLGQNNIRDLIKGIARIVISPSYARNNGREKGYIYFQEFIPNNEFDIRVIVIGDKSFAIKRMVRNNDFRASGSGDILYDKDQISIETVKLSFNLAEKLKSQCASFDFIFRNDIIYVVEVSFGFTKEAYDLCPGYWDSDLNWHEGAFNPYGWMVEMTIR